MKNPNYDLVLEDYISSSPARRRKLAKRYPKFAPDLVADSVVIGQLESVAESVSAKKSQLRELLDGLETKHPETSSENSARAWLRLQPWSLAVGGVAVFVLVFGSVLVFQMRSPSTGQTKSTVAANGTITNIVSQIGSDAQAEQTVATLDEQPTSQLDSQIKLSSQYQSSLGEIYNAVVQ
jgi:hypothetical protein